MLKEILLNHIQNLTTQDVVTQQEQLFKSALLLLNMESTASHLQVVVVLQLLLFIPSKQETTSLFVTMFMEEHKDISDYSVKTTMEFKLSLLT